LRNLFNREGEALIADCEPQQGYAVLLISQISIPDGSRNQCAAGGLTHGETACDQIVNGEIVNFVRRCLIRAQTIDRIHCKRDALRARQYQKTTGPILRFALVGSSGAEDRQRLSTHVAKAEQAGRRQRHRRQLGQACYFAHPARGQCVAPLSSAEY
jgi:hypothetical protein